MAAQSNSQDRRMNELDHNVERIFDVRKRLGKGAYGIVWKATDKRQKDTVALKKIFDAFRDETDAQRTYREVIFLRAFRHHPNIIRMLDIYKAANNLDFYLVFEFMESDLHNVIKKGDILKDIHKRFVMYQLINAIKYMHSGNVIHRDLKPSNILIDSKCRLKVADFGLARTLSVKRRSLECEDKDELENEPVLTDYVATRWYRAPEILVASRKYTKGIDMWSLGCILGEMIRQKPLFQGTSTVNQIEKIVNALPDVTQRDIDSIGASFGSVLLSKKIVRDRRYSLEEMLRNSCDDALGLVRALLVLDPDGRLTAKAAIGHPYVNRFRTASADMEMRCEVHPPLQDDMRYGVEEYRSNLYEMINVEPRPPVVVNAGRGEEGSSRSYSMPKSRASGGAAQPTAMIEPNTNANPNQNLFGVNTIRRNYTQAWSEGHQMQQQQQPQPMAPPHPPPNAVQEPQQQQALRRELAAVAATAPHSSTSLWQAPVGAIQQQLQPPVPLQPQEAGGRGQWQPERHFKQLQQPQPQPLAANDPNSLYGESVAHRRRSRSRRAMTAVVPPVCAAQSSVQLMLPAEQDKAQRQRLAEAKPRNYVASVHKRSGKTHSQRHSHGHSQAHGAERERDQKQKSQQLPEQQLEQQAQRRQLAEDLQLWQRQERQERLEQDKQQQVELAQSLSRLQLQPKKQRKHSEATLQRRRQAEEQQQMTRIAEAASQDALNLFNQQMRLQQEQHSEPAEVRAVASAPAMAAKEQLERYPPPAPEEEPLCYQTRISYLESEMAKCKRQLVNYVQDNQELLSKGGVRYHIEQLQQPATGAVNAIAAPKSPQNDSGIYLEEPEAVDSAPKRAGRTPYFHGLNQEKNYERFKAERDKQKELQMKEFITRDESNAYELPDLCNVYKAKSYHSLSQHERRRKRDRERVRVREREREREREMEREMEREREQPSYYEGQQLGLYPQKQRNFPRLWDAESSVPAPAPAAAPAQERADDYYTTEEWLRSCQKPGKERRSPPYERMRPEDIQEAHFYDSYNEFQSSSYAVYRE